MAVQIRDDVRDHPELYSQIYTPHPVVVPGGRFRELYYWLVSPFITYIDKHNRKPLKTDLLWVWW